MVNESSYKIFPGRRSIASGSATRLTQVIREIVGVLRISKDAGLDQDQWPAEYYHSTRNTDTYFSMLVRTRAMRDVIAGSSRGDSSSESQAAVERSTTMTQNISDSYTAYLHRSAVLVGGFAVLALVLGVVGLYGVIAYSVSRGSDIGRAHGAGAQKGSVYRLILGEATAHSYRRDCGTRRSIWASTRWGSCCRVQRGTWETDARGVVLGVGDDRQLYPRGARRR